MTYHNRHECKYLVPESVAARVLRLAMPFVEPDAHAQKHANHAYTIASLYLDDEHNTLYRETREGQAFRFKLRVRSYTDDPDAPVFLEVKRRHDRVVQKMRCPVPRQALPAILAGEPPALPGMSPEKGRSLHEFIHFVRDRRTVPRCCVRYERQAYVGLDEDVRVTFDRRLSVLSEQEPLVRLRSARYTTVPTAGVVLELKFTDQCPAWMLETVRTCELRRTSFSKYCTSVDSLANTDRVDAF